MKQCTLVFLVKREDGAIAEVCLAMKKRGWGEGRWNGAGGKLLEGETFEQATRRETLEEIGVEAGELEHMADLTFHYPEKPEQNLFVKVYVASSWTGELRESEEMKPAWFSVKQIPYEAMWEDDKHWLPRVLSGEKVTGAFTFGLEHNMLSWAVEALE